MAKKKAKPKLSDSELFDLAERNILLEARIDKLNKRLAHSKAKVIKELEARGTEAIEHGGKRINGVWANDTVIDGPGLLADLTPKQRKLVMSEALDRKKLSRAIQAGTIDPVVFKKHSGLKPKSPYYRYSTVGKKKR